jgi:hypothetical protein
MAEAQGRPLVPVLALVVNAFVWGVSWWPFRALQQEGVHPLWSTALIYLLAFAGFDVQSRARKGLQAMRDRAAAIGAQLRLESAPGRTVVEIALAP